MRTALLGIVLMLGLSQCVTYRKCLDKYGQDTLKVKVYDTIRVELQVPIPPDSVRGQFSEQAIQDLFNGVIDSLVVENESKTMSLKLWMDKVNRLLQAEARKKPHTVVVTKEVPVYYEVPCPPVVVLPCEPRTWYEELWAKFQFFSAFLVLAGLCFLLFMYLKPRR